MPTGRLGGLVAVIGVSVAIAHGNLVGSAPPDDSSASAQVRPPTLGELGMDIIQLNWAPDEVSISLGANGDDEGELTMVCNGVESQPLDDNPAVELVEGIDTLDVTCEVSSGETVRVALPGMLRNGDGLVLSSVGTETVEQCSAERPDESEVLDRLFPRDQLQFWCPQRAVEWSVEPAGSDIMILDVGVVACTPTWGGDCPSPEGVSRPTDPPEPEPTGAVEPTVEWRPDGVRVSIAVAEDETGLSLTCNGVEGQPVGDREDELVVQLDGSESIGVSCDLGTAGSFDLAVPALRRNVAGLVRSDEAVAALDQCTTVGMTGRDPDESTWSQPLFQVECPVGVGDLSVEPAGADIHLETITIETCLLTWESEYCTTGRIPDD